MDYKKHHINSANLDFLSNRVIASVFVFALCLIISSIGFAQEKDIHVLLEQIKNAKVDSVKIEAYNFAFRFYNGNNNDSAYKLAEEGLLYFKANKNIIGQGWMYLNKGDYEDAHGSSTLARSDYQKALDLFTSANYKKGIAGANNNLGTLDGKIGNYEKSLAYFMEAQKINEEIGNLKGLMNCYINLGVIYDELKDSAKTILNYKKADSLSQILPYEENKIINYLNIGEFYADHKDTANAFAYYNKAVLMSNKPGLTMMHLIATMDLGVYKYKNGDIKNGKTALLNALDYAMLHNLPMQEVDIYLSLVELDKSLNINTAIAYLEKALLLARNTDNKPQVLKIYIAYSSFHEKNSNFELSNKYLKLQHALSDSLFNLNKAKEIANLTSAYELEKSNEKVHSLEIFIRKIKVQKIVIIVIGLVIIILFFVLLYFYKKTTTLYRNLQESKDELSELNNMKDKLLSILGHDLRGPIANIPPILEFIESEIEIPEEFKEVFPSLSENTKVILETLDKLMLLGQSLMKQNKFDPSIFNPLSYVEKNMQLLSFSAQKKKITVKTNLPTNISLFADPMHFDFIFRNLLSNAIKFSFSGGLIEVDADENKQQGYIVFSVKDHGVGINPDRLNNMFKSSIRSTYGTENEKGNGIGLLLCKEFVTVNSGNIWLESQVGKGSTFYFSLKKATT